MTKEKKLLFALLVYGLYVALMALSNVFMKMSIASGNESFEMVSGILLGFVGIPIFSIIIPFYLTYKWKLDFSFWPKQKKLGSVLGLMILFLFLINFESIKALMASGLSLNAFAVHFISIMLFHTTYYPLFVLLLFPVLRLNFNVQFSILLTALAFSLYHLAQFHFYPSGLTLSVQIFLFSYFSASLLLYLWSESLILVAIVHQFSGAFAVAANGSIHDEIDFLFYLTIVIISLFFGYMIVQAIRNKDNYNESWWLWAILK
jgi:hypothetical protein